MKSEDLKMPIQCVAGKEKQFIREIQIKIFFEESTDVLNYQNTFWTKHRDGTTRQSIDWIYYFFNTMKLTVDTNLHSFAAKKKKIEYFRNLAYSLEKDKKKESIFLTITP